MEGDETGQVVRVLDPGDLGLEPGLSGGGVGGIEVAVHGVQLREDGGHVPDHLGGPLRVHPDVGVVLVVVVVALMAQGGQQRHPLGAVDDGGVGGGQGVGHEVLQAHAVHDDDVGGLDGLHIVDGEGVIMETGDLLLDEPGDLHPLHPFRDGGGEEVDRVGGGQDVKGIVFLRRRGGGRRPAAAGGEEEQAGEEQGEHGFFHGNTSIMVWIF